MINYSKHFILSFKTFLLLQENVPNLIFRIWHFPTKNYFSSIVLWLFFIRFFLIKQNIQIINLNGNFLSKRKYSKKFHLDEKQIWGKRKEMTTNQSGWKNHVNDPLLKQPKFHLFVFKSVIFLVLKYLVISVFQIICNLQQSWDHSYGKLLRKMKDNCLFCTCGFCFNEVKKYYTHYVGP